jgi:tRNA A-37 threonylcarbamoyl transferase component Bud32
VVQHLDDAVGRRHRRHRDAQFVDKGRELGIPVPTVTAAYRFIKVLDHYLA